MSGASASPAQGRILEITSYPPPRSGWGVRVQFLKRYLESRGHRCVVLNIGSSRAIPSPEYETVLGGLDYLRKVWRFSRAGYRAHVHVNGASPKGFVLAIAAELLNLAAGQRPVVTFHAGIDQVYFPRPKAPALLPVFWLLFTLPETVICNSEEVKDRIAAYGIRRDKIRPIQAFSTQYLEAADQPLPAAVEAFLTAHPFTVFAYAKMRALFYPAQMLDGFARFAAAHPDAGLLLCGIAGHMEPDVWAAVQARLASPALAGRVLVVEDLPHASFLEALRRSQVYLRTHVSDGVCSSVLESLAVGVPVVATENHNRPAGVITYPAEDVEALVARLEDVRSRRAEIAAALPRQAAPDTLAEEAQVLIG